MRCLVDGAQMYEGRSLTARTPGGRMVHLNGTEDLIGTFQRVRITDSSTWALFGELETTN